MGVRMVESGLEEELRFKDPVPRSPISNFRVGQFEMVVWVACME
jgi:hypothetical protein